MLAPPASKTQLRVHLEPHFDFGSRDYRALFADSRATAFQSPEWLHAFYSEFATGRTRPAVLTIRRAFDLRLLAVLPFTVRSIMGFRIAEFADLELNDYCAPVCSPDLAAEFLDDATRDRIRSGFSDCDLVTIRKIRDADLPILGALGFTEAEAMAFRSHASELGPCFARWRQSKVTGGHRRSLDKKRRQVARHGTLMTEALEDPRDLEDVLAQISRLRKARFPARKMRDLLEVSRVASFYRRVSREQGPVRAYRMTSNGVLLSAVFGVAHAGSFLPVLTGFDPIKFRNASLGLLIMEDIARDCIGRGEHVLDLGIGDQPYKTIFGTRSQDLWRVTKAISARGRLLLHATRKSPKLLNVARYLLARF